MATDNSKTNIFRFLNVRPPVVIDPVLLEEKFIFYEITPSTYFNNLIAELDDETNPRQAVEIKAAEAEGTSTIYTQSNLYSTAFNNFDKIESYLFKNLDTVTKNELKNEAESLIGGTLSSILSHASYAPAKSKVWDTLFFTEIVTRDEGFMQKLMIILRVCRLLELIQANSPLVDFNPGIQTQARANVVLPKPLFPLPKKIIVDSNNHNNIPPPTDIAAIKATIASLEAARADIVSTYDKQQSTFKTKLDDLATYSKKVAVDVAPSPSSQDRDFDAAEKKAFHDAYLLQSKSFTISTSNFQNLTAQTKALLTSLGFDENNMAVADALAAIDAEIAKNYALLKNAQPKQKVVQAGATLVRVDLNAVNASVARSGVMSSKEVSPALVSPLGIGDMLVIRQELLKYEEGEIAHIENILASERKLRSHKSLSRTETITELESYRETEAETNTRSTKQLEMAQALNEFSQAANQSASGVTISASYGPVSANAFAQQSAQSLSSSDASSSSRTAREYSESARERIIESVRELRITTSLKEIEILNEHEIDNTGTDPSHIIGHYHWIDKKYLNQVFNIGKRLMYEFLIPEPAAFYIRSLVVAPETINLPQYPENPLQFLAPGGGSIEFSLINRANFGQIVAGVNAEGFNPPPDEYLYVGAAFANPNLQGFNVDAFNDSIKVPDGYIATHASVVTSLSVSNDQSRYVNVKVGSQELRFVVNEGNSVPLQGLTGNVPIGIHSGQGTYHAVNVVVECKLTPRAYKEWQLSVYNKAMGQYREAIDEYNFEVERINAENSRKVENNISGYNPTRNRSIERNELKKAAIQFMTAQRFDDFNSMLDNFSDQGYPDFDFEDALNEGKSIRFFEQAFEWNEMTYLHYPYFWGRKDNWMQMIHFEDADPKFSDFLKAGATRVVVPVRPEFTKAMLHYQKTGEIWAGQDLPELNDELHLSIVEEIKDSTFNVNGTPVGAPWITKLPTNLVRLNASTTPDLPDNSAELL